MQKQIVSTQSAPKAIGPYEQAIKVGDFIYASGQYRLIRALAISWKETLPFKRVE
jgi:enamine deaminase RidA (YjgF/YER057c/UK114 family)